MGGLTLAAATALPAFPDARPTLPVRYARGASIPDWLEVNMHSGVFGTDVEIVAGGVELFRVQQDWDPAFAATYRTVRVAPVSPLQPGECLIRYLGAGEGSTEPFRCLRGGGIRDGGPEALTWLQDGPDLLHIARVPEPLHEPERPSEPAPMSDVEWAREQTRPSRQRT